MPFIKGFAQGLGEVVEQRNGVGFGFHRSQWFGLLVAKAADHRHTLATLARIVKL
jgi:hypothetical protein